METIQRMVRTHGLKALVGAIMFGILILIPLVGGNGGGGFANPSASTSATPTPTPTPSPSASNAGCDPAYKQVAVKHDNSRVDSDFSVKYATATVNANNLSDAQINLLLEESGHNGQVLAIWSHAAGLYGDPAKWSTLVAGDCLSKDGQKLHDQFEGALKAKGTKVAAGDAPATGYNSGVSNGTYGVDAAQGIGGDRKAIQITLKDGTTFWIMVRCANPVFPGKPSLPSVPTDNPPKPTPPPSGCTSNCTPPPPPTCTTDCPKHHSDDTTPPGGVSQQPNDPYEPPATVTAPSNPAPVQSGSTPPSSGSQAPGATAPAPSRPQPPAGTGTTEGGSSGGVNPTGGDGSANTGNNGGAPITNPFG